MNDRQSSLSRQNSTLLCGFREKWAQVAGVANCHKGQTVMQRYADVWETTVDRLGKSWTGVLREHVTIKLHAPSPSVSALSGNGTLSVDSLDLSVSAEAELGLKRQTV